MKNFIVFYIFIIVVLSGYAQNFEQNLDKAYKFFELYNTECKKENAQLWNISYCSNLAIIDNENRILFSLEPIIIEAKEYFQDGIYCYVYPETMMFSSGVNKFGDKIYALLNFDDKDRMLETAFHEMTHKFQEDSNVNLSYNNKHIDTKYARAYIRLEAKALFNAFTKDNKRDFIIDALFFRQKRQNMFIDAKENEDAFELIEGLAQFSGMIIAYKDSAVNLLINDIQNLIKGYFDARTFGYYTGDAYSFLNNDSLHWNYNIYDVGCITAITKKIYNITDIDLQSQDEDNLFKQYDFSSIFKEEEKRENAMIAKNKEKLKILENNPKLIIQNLNNYTLHLRVSPYIINDTITYYSTIGIEDKFGYIYTENDCFIIEDKIIFILPNDLNIEQMNNNFCDNNFCIKLNKNYAIEKQDSNYILSFEKLKNAP
ncbi:MAG: hypothetical protein LBM25_02585, partial [Bacteroidales bacterium]|jgi:hypothetical protein|nr:hypothetical protein [Bacteroidales bacterium]